MKNTKLIRLYQGSIVLLLLLVLLGVAVTPAQGAVDIINDYPPIANSDSYSTNKNEAFVEATIGILGDGVLANDTDVDNNPITAVLDIMPTNGALTLNSDGSFTYSPYLDFCGDDSFVYHANDGTFDSNLATVYIGVNCFINNEPVADAGGSYSGNVGSAIPMSGASASDDDGDPLSFSWAVDSFDCIFSDATTLNPSLTCTTDGNFTVTLTVDDGISMTSDDAAVIIAQQDIENLENYIQSLVEDETLKTGQANGLLRPLNNAIRSLDKGNVEDACNQLNDFILNVNEKTPTPLDTATAAELIDSAEVLKSSIDCQ